MNNRQGRRVHLTFCEKSTKATLAWFEQATEGDRGFRTIELRYTGETDGDRVGSALNMLVPHWSRVFVSSFSKSIISCELDKDPELFDQITQSVTPELFFISSDVLQYKGGQSASLRLSEIEFNEKYATLIAFNKQVTAQA